MILVGMSLNGRLVDVHLTQDVDLEKKLFDQSMKDSPLNNFATFYVFGDINSIVNISNPVESYSCFQGDLNEI